MHAHTDRLEFAPPAEPAAVRAFTLAILAHILLMIALTWGINWKKETESVAAEAELWSTVPQQAAPPVVEPPPVVPKPEPVPVPKVEPPVNRDAEIAVEREKRRQALIEERRQEEEKLKKLEARKKREDLEREKKLEAKRKQEELRREQIAEEKAEKKAAEEKR
ncbi:MAG TPA: protein TolA, partial [Ramlibacter sp.]|nr:protein TolA [Ramlibacter sp.]